MVEKSNIQINQIDPSWFNIPPVHPEITHLNQELMLQVIPTALKMTFDEIQKIDHFNPAPLFYSTKDELLEAIKLKLEEGITPAKGYKKEVYVLQDFPISGELTINDCIYYMGLGHVSLTDGHWSAYLADKEFESIPNETLSSMIKEFDLKYQKNKKSDYPHFLRTNPDNDGTSNAWYLKDLPSFEAESFARNLTFAYTDAFLEFYNSTISDESLESFSENESLLK